MSSAPETPGASPGVLTGSSPRWGLWLALACALAYLFAVCRVAWICDDAYISFRALDNLVSGQGLVWNADERVQAFTNTLWVLLLTPFYAASGSVYWTALAVSLAACILFAVVFLRGLARTPWSAACALGACAASKAFVEYSTSGLEGPLLHLVLAAALWSFLVRHERRSALFAATCATSAAALTRPDALLLVGPWLVWELGVALSGRGRRRTSGEPMSVRAALGLGLAPLVVWELFSVFYYGFPLPNTAYAKLSTGLARSERAGQGLAYLRNSLEWDPATLGVIGLGVVSALLLRTARAWIVLGSLLLYLGYVVWVGGDFMSGRFLTPAFVCAVALVARLAWRPPLALAALVVFALLAGLNERGAWRTPRTWGAQSEYELARALRIDEHGVADERFVYFPYTGVFTTSFCGGHELFGHVTARHPHAARLAEQAQRGERLVEAGMIGFIGYWAGPGPHLVDRLGLADPLLARLPIAHQGAILYERNLTPERSWRVGHYYREPPTGYLDTLRLASDRAAPTGRGELDIRLEDEGLAEFWEALALATRGKLLSSERLAAIWDLNRGRWDAAIEAYDQRLADAAAAAGTPD